MPFQIGLSGLNAATSKLRVTANNIANSSTTGFKESRAEFVESGGGHGVRVAELRQNHQQGIPGFTGNGTDLAVTGNGYFLVEDGSGRHFSRDGRFGLDRDGNVVNSSGQRLQVFPPANGGFDTGRTVDLNLAPTAGTPQATGRIAVSANLDAGETARFDRAGGSSFDRNSGVPFDGADPATYNYRTSTTAYDSQGGSHQVDLFFRRLDDSTAPGGLNDQWQVFAQVDGQPLSPSDTGNAGSATAEAAPNDAGVLSFNGNGTLASAGSASNPGPSPSAIAYSAHDPGNGAASLDLTIDFAGLSQFGADYATGGVRQDGSGAGQLTGFDIGADGAVTARYDNGSRQTVGKVAMASVPNPQGLQPQGDSVWSGTYGAGDTTVGQPGTGGLGVIQSGALEASNVDLADQMVNLIDAQRHFEANVKVIDTADEMTQTLVNLRDDR